MIHRVLLSLWVFVFVCVCVCALVPFPLVSCQNTTISPPTVNPAADDLTFQECISFINQYSICVSGRINRCQTVNMTLRVTSSKLGFDQYYNVSANAPTLNPPAEIDIPASSIPPCSKGTVKLTFDPNVWRLTPSYAQIQPRVTFNYCGLNGDKAVLVTAGADCSSATSCQECAILTEPRLNTHPCGWCPATRTCSASNAQNQPYCVAGCSSGALLRTNDQCTAAAAQSTEDTWTPSKTATVVILAIVIPIGVILIALCLRRSYVRRRAKAGATSGVGSIQARTQGYRPTSESVSGVVHADSTENSINGTGASNADFRQMEGYNPPSTRPANMDNV